MRCKGGMVGYKTIGFLPSVGSIVMERVSVKRRSRPRSRNDSAPTNGNGEPIDFGPLATWIGFNLRMAQDASFQAFSRLSQEIGVRPGRFATLSSRAEEFHLRALPEPYVNLSIHTAPDVRPLP